MTQRHHRSFSRELARETAALPQLSDSSAVRLSKACDLDESVVRSRVGHAPIDLNAVDGLCRQMAVLAVKSVVTGPVAVYCPGVGTPARLPERFDRAYPKAGIAEQFGGGIGSEPRK